MESLQLYDAQGKQVMTIIRDGDMWFAAKGSGTVLEYPKLSEMLKKKEDEVDSTEVGPGEFEQERDMLHYNQLPDYLTIDELRTWLRIGSKKAYDLANTPGFPCIRYGSKKIFPKAEVREWLTREAQRGRLSRKLRTITGE